MPFPSSIRAAAQELRQESYAPLDLVDACLEQIDQHEPQVRAWVSVDADGARAEARRLHAARRPGGPLPPLWGIPLGIKDVFDIAGQPTRAGSRLRARHRAAVDAFSVAKLRAAGAILLGKTVTTEFACFDPPVTRNPWSPEHTPGGSSSGSAAALALGMCLGALGSQTGGSIVRPAAYCGVTGLKPSYGRVSFSGVVGVTTHLDHAGPLGRTVDDLAILFSVMAGNDPADPLSSPRGVPDLAAEFAAGAPPRCGVVRDYFWEAADSEARSAVERTIEVLASRGARVTAAALPGSFGDVHAMHRRIMAVEAASFHRETFPAQRDLHGPNLQGLLDEGGATSALDYAEALRHQKRFRREILGAFADCDFLLMPSTHTAAPGLETTGQALFQAPWSYCGLPEATIPCGVSPAGLPLGLQLVGRPWSEAALLAAAAWCERVINFTARPAIG